MSTSKLTFSRTVEVEHKDAELLNHLVDKLVIPVLEKRQRIAQGALPRKKLTPEQELASILSFGTGERTDILVRRPQIKVAQGGT